MFNYKEFWVNRYKGTIRGNVSPLCREDMAYQDKIKRDEALIAKFLGKHLKDCINCGMEIGSGPGRLAPIISAFCEKYVGMDCTQQVVDVANKAFEGNKYISFRKDDVCDMENTIDKSGFVLTFTVLQHLADEDWESAIKNICKIAKKIFCYENIEFASPEWNGKTPGHVNRKSGKDYELEFGKHGFKLIDSLPNMDENKQSHLFMAFVNGQE